MSKRLDYEHVKQHIHAKGYELMNSGEEITSTQILKIKCPNKHSIQSTFDNFKSKDKNCRYCSGHINVGEEVCRCILEALIGMEFIRTRRINGMENLELDGYCEELKLAFEFNGRQHYEYIELYHRNSTLEDQKKRDEKKLVLCEKNNIKLIIIPFTDHQFEDKVNCIKKQLIDLNVAIKDVELNKFNITKYIGEMKPKNREFYEKCIEQVNMKGGKVLSPAYIDSKWLMDFKCKRGHKFSISWADLQRGSFCKICTKKLDKVLEEIEMYGYKYCELTKYTRIDAKMYLMKNDIMVEISLKEIRKMKK
jgi:hypothetical protein